MADDKIDIKIGATTGELKSGMDQSANVVKQATSQMRDNFRQLQDHSVAGMKQMQNQVQTSVAGISSHLKSIGTVVTGVTALLAGGAMFKNMLQETISLAGETRKLNTLLGGTYQETGALIIGAKSVGVSYDTLNHAFQGLAKSLKANREAFVEAGVTIEDNNGKTLSYGQILLNVLDKMANQPTVAGKMAMAYTFLGRAGKEVADIEKLHGVNVQETLAKMERLGINLETLIPKVKGYKQSMADVEIVIMSLKIVIAEQLMPKLEGMARWLEGSGPGAVKFFADSVIKALVAFELLKAGASDLEIRLKGHWAGMRTEHSAWWEVLKATTTLSWDNIVNAWTRGNLKVQVVAASSMADTAKIYEDAIRRIEALFSSLNAKSDTPVPGKTKTAGSDEEYKGKTGGGTGGGGTGGGGTNQVQVWKQELEQMKLAEERFLESTLQDEMKFWKDKLALCREGSKEYTAVQHEVLILSKQLARQEYQERLADIRTQMADERKNSQERLALQDQAVQLAAQKYGLDSVQYQNSLREKKAMLLQFHNEQRQVEIAVLQHQQSLYKIDAEMARAYLNFKMQMGKMFEAQHIQGLKRIAQAEHQYDKQSLVSEQAKYKQSEKEYQQYTKKIELLDKKHLADMKKMDQDYLLALKTQFDQLWSSLSASFTTAIQGMASGTMTFGQAVSSIFQSLGQAILSMVVNVAMQYIGNLILMAVAGQLFNKTAAASGVSASAAKAGAAGFASVMAALPFPINLTVAPMIGNAAMLGAASFLTFASAAGGWDVPADTLAMVHKDEKILPADWPEKLRAVAAPVAAAVSPSHLVNRFTINVVTPDGRTILTQNKTLVFELIKQGIKHGEITIPAGRR